MLSVAHKVVRKRGASVKNLKSRQIASKFGTEPISMVLIMNINKNLQNIVTKVLQMAQRVAQKWHKCPKIEIALNYLKIGTETTSGMLITNMNRTFLEILSPKCSKWHTMWYKKWNKCPKIEISSIFFKIRTESILMALIMNIDKDFQNIVTKMLQMAQK